MTFLVLFQHCFSISTGETGWGNAFAGLGNAASVALTLGYRLNVVHSAFNRLFILPPHADQHAYPAEAAFASIKRVGFDYERDGRNGKFAEFSRDVQSLALRNLKHRYQNEALLESRICGTLSKLL
jgi:hypothetical protein